MFRQRMPDGQAYVFYIDIRSPGKGNDEFVQQAMARGCALPARQGVARLRRRRQGRRVGRGHAERAQPGDRRRPGGAGDGDDAGARRGRPGAPPAHRRRRLRLLQRGAPQAAPGGEPDRRRLPGRRGAGAQGHPGDGGPGRRRGGQGAGLFSRDEMVQEPTVALCRRRALCAACGQCVPACPYGARQMHAWKRLAMVNEALCQGCGACVVACPNKASQPAQHQRRSRSWRWRRRCYDRLDVMSSESL